MPGRKKDADAWRADCERLFKAELELSHKRIQLNDSIPRLVVSAGEQALEAYLGEGAEGAEVAQEVALPPAKVGAVQADIAMFDAAIRTARTKRLDAMRQVKLAEAEVDRKEAQDLRKKSDQHAAVTKRLLAEVEAHEGCEYVPSEPSRFDTERVAVGTTLTYKIPLSAAWRAQAENLESQAQFKEQQQLSDYGEIDGDTFEDLLRQIEGRGALALGPPIVALHEWAKKHEGWEIRLHLTWGRGEINWNHTSAVRVPGKTVFKCDMCEFISTDKRALIQHVAEPVIHAGGAGYSAVDGPGSRATAPSDAALYRCKACEFSSHDEMTMVQHDENPGLHEAGSGYRRPEPVEAR